MDRRPHELRTGIELWSLKQPKAVVNTSSPRVFVINQWLPPDFAPTAVLAGEIIELLRAAGIPLVLISRERAGAAADAIPGIERHVVDRLASGPTGILAKLLAWPTFARRALAVLARELRAGDTLLVTSDPPLFYVLTVLLAKRRGARVVHWSQDVYPDIVEQHASATWLAYLLLLPLRRLRNLALKRVDTAVAISAGMAARLGRAGANVTEIPNWARDDRLHARAQGESSLRRAHFADSDFVLAYSGNLGRVHEFETLTTAAFLLEHEKHIRFLIVGGGPRLAELKARVATNPPAQFVFLGPQPESALEDSLAAGDAHLVSLQMQFEGLVLPSKLYSIAAVGRAMVFCGDEKGEVARLLAEHDCGLSAEPGDAIKLAHLIRSLASDRERCAQMGSNARAMLDQHFSREAALAKWKDVLRLA